MPFSAEVRLDKRVEELERLIYGTQILHLRTTINLYDRDPETQTARLVESRPDLDLLLDPLAGTRVLRSEAEDPAAWDELAAGAKLLHIPITCYEKQLEIICDDHSRVVGVVSGSRAGKTHSIAYRCLRRWMLRGGKGHEFWWIAPGWKQTEIGVKKLCRGSGEEAPVFPPDLVKYYPKDSKQQRQFIELIDGSKIVLHHASGNGDNLKGYDPYDIFFDEVAAVKKVQNWTVAINRLTTHDGTLAAATTPVAGHWVRANIVSRAIYEPTVSHYEISIFDNVWEHPETVKELIASLGGEADPVVQREFFGIWTHDNAALWTEYKPERHLCLDHDVWTVADLVRVGMLPSGYEDVTARAASSFWRETRYDPARYVIGQDFNVNPCSSVIMRVHGRPDDPSTWGVFIVDEVQTRGTIQNHCAILGTVRSGDYAGQPVAADATGAVYGHGTASQGVNSNTTNTLEMERAGFKAQACNIVEGKPKPPPQIDSLSLVYHLMRDRNVRFIVSARCVKTCQALDTQVRDYDGKISKESNTQSDRLSGPTDAMRYGIWSLFNHEISHRAIRNAKANRADLSATENRAGWPFRAAR